MGFNNNITNKANIPHKGKPRMKGRIVERHEKQSAGRNSHRQQSDEPSGCPSDCKRHADADNTYNDILNDWGSIHDGTAGAYGT
ncbi:unnamed protein product [Clavelina lepadiformis]|uniref:Uncharacterized protein n=1 Tax=Clavelina lepadiformis TaxID=159417 RepID=A0ABP0FFS4_CLALP